MPLEATAKVNRLFRLLHERGRLRTVNGHTSVVDEPPTATLKGRRHEVVAVNKADKTVTLRDSSGRVFDAPVSKVGTEQADSADAPKRVPAAEVARKLRERQAPKVDGGGRTGVAAERKAAPPRVVATIGRESMVMRKKDTTEEAAAKVAAAGERAKERRQAYAQAQADAIARNAARKADLESGDAYRLLGANPMPGTRRQRARAIEAEVNRAVKEIAAQKKAERAERAAKMAPILEAKYGKKDFTPEQLKAATHVRTDTGWHKVVKVNAKSVSVETGYSWTDRHAHDKILEVRTIDQATQDAFKAKRDALDKAGAPSAPGDAGKAEAVKRFGADAVQSTPTAVPESPRKALSTPSDDLDSVLSRATALLEAGDHEGADKLFGQAEAIERKRQEKDAKAAAAKAEREARRDAATRAKWDEVSKRIEAGDDPVTAEAQVFGKSERSIMQRDFAMWARSNGYSGTRDQVIARMHSEFAAEQYLQAESELRSAGAIKPQYSARYSALDLWNVNDATARKIMTEEMASWFDANGGRVTRAMFAESLFTGRPMKANGRQDYLQ